MGYIKVEGLMFKGILRDIKKSNTLLQPIFEAFTNSLESIKTKKKLDKNFTGEISIIINAIETTDPENTEFEDLQIIDNGIGFTDKEFKRFNTFKDFTKGFNNRGSGRFQYIHYFDKTIIESNYKQEGKFFERKFSVSKKKMFLDNNAIVKEEYNKENKNSDIEKTVVKFELLIIGKSDIYNKLNETSLKKELKNRYLHYFCHNKNNLPKISIKFYVQSKLKGETTIDQGDIPSISKTEEIKLPYYKTSSDGKGLEKIENKIEKFTIDAFKIEKNILKENCLSFVSKGEIVEKSDVSLTNLSKTNVVDNQRFLFLVSSKYIDDNDTDERGILVIPSNKESSDLFSSKKDKIFIEDIKQGVNDEINKMYPEIANNKKKHDENTAKLKEMFFLNDDDVNILINDSDTNILEKFYKAEAKKAAKLDVSIKESIGKLDSLDTTVDNYEKQLEDEIKKLVKNIPLQNKNDLTHYVARRKLVLNLLGKILDRELDVQKEGRRFDEKLIHNLLFQQNSTEPEKSDLWIINEDFIYFKSSSEKELKDLTLDGKKIFKETFTEKEEKYLNSLGEKRLKRKPDVLLFLEEGKCIILEFKAPNVNASNYLTQINQYASLIRNYTTDDFEITTFYGYLIGESIENNDVLGAVSTFENSYQFDYLYDPSKKVVGFDGKENGSIYTEVIKYSTLLKRAKQRNKIFTDKLKNNS